MIDRGYVSKHKVMGNRGEARENTPAQAITIVSCPNCSKENKIVGRLDTEMDEDVTCSHCRFTTSKWNFEYVKTEEADDV